MGRARSRHRPDRTGGSPAPARPPSVGPPAAGREGGGWALCCCCGRAARPRRGRVRRLRALAIAREAHAVEVAPARGHQNCSATEDATSYTKNERGGWLALWRGCESPAAERESKRPSAG